jgi:hypothetical protein
MTNILKIVDTTVMVVSTLALAAIGAITLGVFYTLLGML